MYTNQNNLQEVVTGLVDQKIKQLVERMITPKFSKLEIKTFENKNYNLQSDVNKAVNELANELYIMISEYVKAKEVDIKKIQPDFKNMGVNVYHEEKLRKYADNVLLNFNK